MYKCSVRTKISITLPQDTLTRIDESPLSRSALIEKACRAYLARLAEINDIRIIEAHADRMNKQAMDVIGYQGLRWLKSARATA